MMRKNAIFAICAVILGIAGAILRTYELNNAFTGAQYLPQPWHPATVALAVCGLILVVGAAVVLYVTRSIGKQDGEYSFTKTGKVFAVAAAALAAISGAYQAYKSGGEKGEIIMGVLLIIAAVCVLVFALSSSEEESEKSKGYMIVPVIFFCFWLVMVFRKWGADPVTLDYVYILLAVICTLVALYEFCASMFVRAKAWCMSFFSICGVYFNIVTLVDTHTVGELLAHGACILLLLAILLSETKSEAVERQ